MIWVGDYVSNVVLKPIECWYSAAPAPFDYRFHMVKWQSQDIKQGYLGAYEYDLCEWMVDQVLKNITEGNAECYADEKLEQRLSLDETLSLMSKIDTVVTFDPDTYEEKIYVIRNDVNTENIAHLKVKFRAYYHEKKRSFSTEMLAYAPLVKESTGGLWEGQTRPLCWVKAPKPSALSPEKIIERPTSTGLFNTVGMPCNSAIFML